MRNRVTHVPSGWTLQAILLNGIDITDTPLPFGKTDQSITDVEVVLSRRVTVINGQVSARGRPAVAAVLLFPADRTSWYPHSRYFARGSAGRDGTFTIVGLPPGNYFALAITAAIGLTDGDDWQDPDYLDAHAARATLAICPCQPACPCGTTKNAHRARRHNSPCRLPPIVVAAACAAFPRSRLSRA